MKTHIAMPRDVLFRIALSLFLHVAGYAFPRYDGFYPTTKVHTSSPRSRSSFSSS
ncbi:MAG: hypothetical protein ABFC38_13715 [Methanospirillum sp.]